MQHKDYGWLSPQELVSCDSDNGGCEGGLAAAALVYIQKNGIVPETCYPYLGAVQACPSTCKDGSSFKSARVCKCTTVINCGTFEGMKRCLTDGPITVRILLYQDFIYYKSGIYCWDQKSVFIGGHALRCVGYGNSPEEYLEMANSWGAEWGERGFFKISTKTGCGARTTANDAWTVKGC